MIEDEALFIGGMLVAPQWHGADRGVLPFDGGVRRVRARGTPGRRGQRGGCCPRRVRRPARWSRWAPERRAEVLDRFAAELTNQAQRTAEAVSSQNGMPIQISVPA